MINVDKLVELSPSYPHVLIAVSHCKYGDFVSSSTYPQVLIRLLLFLKVNHKALKAEGCEYENKD